MRLWNWQRKRIASRDVEEKGGLPMKDATNETMLKVGIIGAGGMGNRHAACWARLPGVIITAVADVQGHKARSLAEKANSGGARAFDSAEALIAGSDIDAVSVCVPTDAHRAVSEVALRAGKHVLCEKPMALTLADCDAMIAAAKAKNVLLTVGQVARFFPEFANAHRLVEAGAVGTPAAVRTRRGGGYPRSDTDWFGDPARSGGVIFDLLVHDLDWLQWCFGPISRVYARGLTERLADKTLAQIDYALLTLRHTSGVISHVEGTWADPGGWATTFEIAGDAGLLTHDSRQAGTLKKALRPEAGGVAAGMSSAASPLTPDEDPYHLQIAAFARAIMMGEPVAVTPEEARSAVAVAVAARESLRSGRAVTVEAGWTA